MTFSLLKINDLTEEQIYSLLRLAVTIKQFPQQYQFSLRGLHFALLFEKPSLRTRASFTVGIEKMGGHAHFYDLQNDKLGQRETIKDMSKNLQQWYQGIIARVDRHQTLKELELHSEIPVVNALCDLHHPCQALADLLTLYEINPDLKQWHLAYIGDGNNVSRSLADLALKLKMKLTLVTPTCGKPNEDYLQTLQTVSEGLIQWTNAIDTVETVDVIYTDVWQSMGTEQKDAMEKSHYFPFQVNRTLMEKWQANYFMHCQPVHRGEEATDEVCDGTSSLIYQQANNRMAIQQALLHSMYNGASNDSIYN